MAREPGHAQLGCVNKTSVILSARHILKIVVQNRTVWGTPKVQANYDCKGLENLDTDASGQIVFTTGMQSCKLDNTGPRGNKESTWHDSRRCKRLVVKLRDNVELLASKWSVSRLWQ